MRASSLPQSTTQAGLLRWPPAVFLVATGLGLVMRLAAVGLPTPLPFDHLLHAHSHALYFGWAALVVLGAAAATAPRVRRWAWAGLALVPPMTVAFLFQGYGPVSIAVSAGIMGVWYGGMAAWWRSGSREPVFASSFAYVVAASAGIWVLAALQATGMGDGLAARLAIHAFLSAFAWSLVLGTLALAIREGLVGRREGSRVASGLAAGAWLLFPLGVVGGPHLPGLGWVARAAAVILLLPVARWCLHLWRSGGGAGVKLAGGWLVIATTGLVGVGVGGDDFLTAVGRPGVVTYLHALLLGYVTPVLVWYLARRQGTTVHSALTVHHVGVAMMLAGVIAPLSGVSPALSDTIAASGAAVTWAAAWGWAVPLGRSV